MTSSAVQPEPVTLVVSDLDGTLWDRSVELHPRTAAAIAELDRRGVPLLVATGRREASTRAALARFGLAPPAVVLNGAIVVDLATGERIHNQAFPNPTASAVLEHFLAAGIEPCVYVDHDEVDVFVGSAPSTHPDHLRDLGATARTADLREVTASQRVLAFGVLGISAAVVEGLEEALAEIANPHVAAERLYGGGGFTVTVAAPGMSKWDGVEAYCRHRGIDPSAVLAIGDGPNDLELLDGAAIALVPADGHPDALARADRVVARAAEGGWAEVLDFLGSG